jgi:hypothetical protein
LVLELHGAKQLDHLLDGKLHWSTCAVLNDLERTIVREFPDAGAFNYTQSRPPL